MNKLSIFRSWFNQTSLCIALALGSIAFTSSAWAKWLDWQPHGNTNNLQEAPVCAPNGTIRGSDNISCYALGNDNKLKHKDFVVSSSGRVKSIWIFTDVNLGANLEAKSKPALVSLSNRLRYMFVRGSDDQMYMRQPDAKEWTALGGKLTSAPACVSPEEGRIDCVVKGSNNEIYWKGYSNHKWSGWESLGGNANSDPTITSWGKNRLDVFVRGANGDAMWHKRWNGSKWGDWASRGGKLKSAPACTSWGNERIHCVVRGGDDALWIKYWWGKWSDWESLGGVLTSAPTVTSLRLNHLEIFAGGENNSFLNRTFFGYRGPRWMQDLESIIGNLRLGEISMPGSHDAGTYDFPWGNHAKTQAGNIATQLDAGVRYFDLRAMWWGAQYHMNHGAAISAIKPSTVMKDINNWLELNPKEIVFLRWRLVPKTYENNVKWKNTEASPDNDDESQIKALIDILVNEIGDKFITQADLHKVVYFDRKIILPKACSQIEPQCLTLQQLWTHLPGKQVIMDVTDQIDNLDLDFTNASKKIWQAGRRGNLYTATWPNTSDVNQLVNVFTTGKGKKRPHRDRFWDAQMLLTAGAAWEGKKALYPDTLWRDSADTINSKIANEWKWWSWNIVTADFVTGLPNISNNFTKYVINLNFTNVLRYQMWKNDCPGGGGVRGVGPNASFSLKNMSRTVLKVSQMLESGGRDIYWNLNPGATKEFKDSPPGYRYVVEDKKGKCVTVIYAGDHHDEAITVGDTPSGHHKAGNL